MTRPPATMGDVLQQLKDVDYSIADARGGTNTRHLTDACSTLKDAVQDLAEIVSRLQDVVRTTENQ